MVTASDEGLRLESGFQYDLTSLANRMLTARVVESDVPGFWFVCVSDSYDYKFLSRPCKSDLIELVLAHLGFDVRDSVSEKSILGNPLSYCPWIDRKKVALVGSIYFIRAAVGGPIKIGFSTCVMTRLREIQSMCPFELVVVAVIQGKTVADERKLHLLFTHARLHGEWFEASLDLLAFIENVRGAVQPISQADSIAPTRSEEESTNNLSEFKKLWKRCSPAGKVAIRIWLDENYLNEVS